MTGLNPDEDRILEVGCLVTDHNLKIIGEEFNVVINQPKSVLDGMNPWCIQHHSKVIIQNICFNFTKKSLFKKMYYLEILVQCI